MWPNLAIRINQRDLDRNKLTHIYPETICAPNLHAVHLSSNNIRFVAEKSFQKLSKTKTLFLSNNLLSHLPTELFKKMATTSTLRLQTNKLSFIDTGAFSGMNKLQLLQLSGNPIRNFYEFQLPAVAFMDFLGLSRSYPLKLHGNGNLAKAKKNSVVIKVLDLTNNFLSKINQLDFGDCRTLNVSSNALYNIHLDALEPFAKLQSLMLQYNNLQKLDFIRPLSQLIVLSLTSNSIKAINVKDFAKLASLKELYLQHNQISDVNAVLKGLKNIRIIYLSDNTIETLKNKSFTLYQNLRILDLSNNAVTLSDQEDLGLTFLEELNLAGNEITYLNCSGLPPVLRSLTLANNNIVKIDPNCDRLFYQVTKIDMSYTNLIANGIDLQKDFLDKLNLVNDLKLAGNNWPGILEGMAAIINLKLDISDNPVILDTFIRDLYDRVGQFLIGMCFYYNLDITVYNTVTSMNGISSLAPKYQIT
ncbi:uncharacterized protein TRIADDRAFT_61531 [Trichoplax adhaerens]|uniref:Uncharacterized protein n=1 Tax=Trichoplax adhaerens TaxID=10228 RepID=B3SB90_TRIAD|nr:hypothetical protein TRIADDRAFT_61531 [Trichoplax adhaerens]EDV19958.1 hypothetical protein TRIADDRAFT_61531 [Trichoplax adhaerens]|eukprot:XP_002117548.1 hypothetical protein TRIADDRAFT_61531 [Trichoplax adhaerens]